MLYALALSVCVVGAPTCRTYVVDHSMTLEDCAAAIVRTAELEAHPDIEPTTARYTCAPQR